MTKHVWLLHGGLLGTGKLTSLGMSALAAQIRNLTNVGFVKEYPWGKMETARREIIIDAAKHDSKIILIGYSGGGSRATMIANATPRPRIDLLVLYDPSPKWQMAPVPHNVGRAICYQNSTPLMFGLGGGIMISQAAASETHHIAEQHLLVQSDPELHHRTLEAVRAL